MSYVYYRAHGYLDSTDTQAHANAGHYSGGSSQ